MRWHLCLRTPQRRAMLRPTVWTQKPLRQRMQNQNLTESQRTMIRHMRNRRQSQNLIMKTSLSRNQRTMSPSMRNLRRSLWGEGGAVVDNYAQDMMVDEAMRNHPEV